MAGKLKLLVCCGNGAGTSMMIKLNVEKVTKKMGLASRKSVTVRFPKENLPQASMISFCAPKTL